MSTVPVAVSPGFRFEAVSTAAVFFELTICSVPEAKLFEGFAVCAVNAAPEPTATLAASSTTASTPRVRRGCSSRIPRRAIVPGIGTCGRPLYPGAAQASPKRSASSDPPVASPSL